MRKIHIAYALNDKYAEMTCVSMCSVLANCKNTEIVFHLFAERLSEEHIKKLSKLNARYANTSICFHDILIDGDLFVTAKSDAIGAPDLTKETYVRLMLPDLLPDLDRVLYLDCDTIAEGNIAELWQTDLDGALVGMVPNYWLDTPEGTETRNHIHGIGANGVCFNGGVFLMNLSDLRKFGLAQIASENVGRLYKQIMEAGLVWLADHDVLNYALRGKIKKLPMRFNSYFWISHLMHESFDECINALKNPVIIHFLGTPKPNELGDVPVLMPGWERYYIYKAISPFASDDDEKKVAAYKAREDKTLDALKPCFDYNSVRWYCNSFAKHLFELAFQRHNAAMKKKDVVIWGLNEKTWTLTVFLSAHGLGVIGIVDGLEMNQGIKVFDHAVQSPDMLRECCGETFVMLDMRNYDIAQQIMADMQSWVYTEEDYYHVYAPIWEGTGQIEGENSSEKG